MSTDDPAPSALDLQVLTQGDDSMFIPKKLVPVKLAGTHIQAYPETDHMMPPSERLYALLCNMNAATTCFVPPAQIISFYAGRSNVETKARLGLGLGLGLGLVGVFPGLMGRIRP
eukprot:scaffold149965_cov36-Cyclotella_meneghiniana.AAC.2